MSGESRSRAEWVRGVLPHPARGATPGGRPETSAGGGGDLRAGLPERVQNVDTHLGPGTPVVEGREAPRE